MQKVMSLLRLIGFTLILVAPLSSWASNAEAEKFAKNLYRQLRGTPPKGKPAFTVRKCERISAQNWAKLLLLGQPIEHQVKFAEGCDLEGTLRLSSGGFPVDMKLRHVEGTERLKGYIQPNFTPDFSAKQVRVEIVGSKGEALPAGLEFGFDYEFSMGMDGKIREDKGGTLSLTRFRKRKVTSRIPIRFR